jgi:orotate phosphoribosyltransferase
MNSVMSTGQDSSHAFDQFFSPLDLRGVTFRDCPAEEYLRAVWSFAWYIWDEVEERHYTNHDTYHSRNIVAHFLDLNRLYEWSPYEKMVFAASALIHDIGMQYNRWAPHVNPPRRKRKLSEDQVREQHVDLAAELLFGYIYKDWRLSFPVPCPKHNQSQVAALDRAVYIACAHHGDAYLNKLAEDDQTWRSRPKFEGGRFRPRLLAGVLRLCDELDGNHNRLRANQQNEILSWNISDETRRHWLACLFVESAEIVSVDASVAGITFNWQVPRHAPNKDFAPIRVLLGTMREAKLTTEIKRVDDFYKRCGEEEHIRHFAIKFSKRPARFAFPLYEKIGKVVRAAVEKRHSSLPRQLTTNLVHDNVRDEALTEAIGASPEEGATGRSAETIEDSLRTWFADNAMPGHFELVSGEHTDTYLNCRSLISKQALLRRLATRISTTHQAHEIDVVLAVGTSAIPIAVNVAHRLSCAASFTMYSDRQYTRNITKEYHPIELEPTVTKGQTVLIIDDVISGGSVTKRVLDFLDSHGKTPKRVYHQAIFRLGSRHYIRDPRVATYSWVLHMPEVTYAEVRKCPMCRSATPLQKETEMH